MTSYAGAPVIVATIYWQTEADGTPVPDDLPLDEMPRCHYGPFDSEDAAAAWLDDYPDGDTDVADMDVETITPGPDTYINPPSTINPERT